MAAKSAKRRQSKRWIALQAQLDEAHILLRAVAKALVAMHTAEASRNLLIIERGPGDTHSKPAPHLVAEYYLAKINTLLGDE